MALMTGAAVLAVLWPLSRSGRVAAPDGEDDLDFYRHQLRDIADEADRGLLAAGDAENARIEAGRRLLRAQNAAAAIPSGMGEPCLRRRRAAAALCLSIVPLIGLAAYGGLGSPNLVFAPPHVAAAPADDMETALARIEAHLAVEPNDPRGWDVVAPVYLRIGRFDDAARAYAMAARTGGETADRLAGQGEAVVGSAGGVVSADAAGLFARAATLDPAAPRPRFYLALAAEQDGDRDRARAGFERIIADAPADAPWLGAVRDRLARLSGAEPVARLDPGSVTPAIRAMVEGLDSRLRDGGGTEPEWARLVRAYVVLGQPDRARQKLGEARTALLREDGAGARLDGLARELGLAGVEVAQ